MIEHLLAANNHVEHGSCVGRRLDDMSSLLRSAVGNSRVSDVVLGTIPPLVDHLAAIPRRREALGQKGSNFGEILQVT